MTILDRILATKRNEVDFVQRRRPLNIVRLDAELQPPPRDFFAAVSISTASGPNLIAEIKRKSPSAGLIVNDFDPVRIARMYQQAGAAAISVLTDETYFDGRLDYISAVRAAVPVPVLRKDFIIDDYQIHEARAAGADAVLLIAAALFGPALSEFTSLVRSQGMTPLIEVHSEAELDVVLRRQGPPAAGSYLLGINNRDLARQRTDRDIMVRLGRLLPPGAPWVAESGLSSREDVLLAGQAGASAVLIGESILKSGDIEGKAREIIGR